MSMLENTARINCYSSLANFGIYNSYKMLCKFYDCLVRNAFLDIGENRLGNISEIKMCINVFSNV